MDDLCGTDQCKFVQPFVDRIHKNISAHRLILIIMSFCLKEATKPSVDQSSDSFW